VAQHPATDDHYPGIRLRRRDGIRISRRGPRRGAPCGERQKTYKRQENAT
jgi:hypothetical protein